MAPPRSGQEPEVPAHFADPHLWPPLPWEGWRETAHTLHRWTQIVGKVRTARAPWVNHSWHVALHLTSRGLTTGPIPGEEGTFEILFDFLQHRLQIQTSGGGEGTMELAPRLVADFHDELMARLAGLGVATRIHPAPNELEDATPFALDHRHHSYDPDAAQRFWRILSSSARVLEGFRAGFIGKCSPVHFFWGSFDLAVTRFSGRTAPPHPGGIPNLPDDVAREAYSHEVSSLGFWPGNDAQPEPIFYSYAYPGPPGFPEAAVEPSGARWHPDLGEFVLPYEVLRRSANPELELMRFARSSYEAAAELGRWDREALEWGPGGPPVAGARGPWTPGTGGRP